MVSVDYGLAPESPFPGPVDDVHEALNWLLYSEEARDAFDLRSDQVFIGGESAGGTLAAAAVAMKEDHAPSERESRSEGPPHLSTIRSKLHESDYQEHMHVNGALTGDQMIHFWRLYQGKTLRTTAMAATTVSVNLNFKSPARQCTLAKQIHLAKYDVLCKGSSLRGTFAEPRYSRGGLRPLHHDPQVLLQ